MIINVVCTNVTIYTVQNGYIQVMLNLSEQMI